MKIQTKLLGSLVLSALVITGMTGCGSDDTAAAASTEETISPYKRIAVLSGTWADVPALADTIASYVVTTDENAVLGYPTNWVVAGANPASGETYETTDLLPIPGMGVAGNTGTSRVIELCNGAYATQATGTGRFHGSALPCEVSVHSDGTNLYVDMLDADAIFSVFFADLNDTQKTGLKSVASAVKSEIEGMVIAALDDAGEIYTPSTLALGPVWDTDDIERLSYRSPYTVYSYKLDGGSAITTTETKALASEIIAVLGSDVSTADVRVPGLSNASAWRSGRPEPLAIPGVFVAEACSPKYAKMATTLGNEYITALPCEITVYVDENDATGQTLSISFLNPNFMFGTMFEGAVEAALANGTLDKDDAILYSTLADKVFADLRMIVDHAVQTSAIGTFTTTPVVVAP